MYELDDDKICNDKYWVTLTENTHIKSSGEAAKILKRLESDGVLPQPHRTPRGQHQEVAGLAPAQEGLGVGLPDGVVEDEGAVKIRGKQAHAGEHSSRSASPPRAPAHRRRNTSTESSQRTRSRVVCEDSVEVCGT